MSANLAERSKKYAEEAQAFYQHAQALRLKAEEENRMLSSILNLVAKIGEKLTKLPFVEMVNSFERWLDAQPSSSVVNHNSPEYAEYLRLKRVGRELEVELEKHRRETSTQDNPKEAKGTLLFSTELNKRNGKPELEPTFKKRSLHKGR